MGGDSYPPILVYGIKLTLDDLNLLLDKNEEEPPYTGDELIVFFEKLVKKSFGLKLYHFVEEAYSRWEGRQFEANDFFYLVGELVDEISSDTLRTIKEKVDKELEDIRRVFTDKEPKYYLGISIYYSPMFNVS